VISAAGVYRVSVDLPDKAGIARGELIIYSKLSGRVRTGASTGYVNTGLGPSKWSRTVVIDAGVSSKGVYTKILGERYC
jgi:hypothetical protein